jgi:glycosyltransferase involved in cell wall biosynthesis
MNLLVVTNNPERASFKQRIGVYIDILRDNNIDCKIAVLPAGLLARRNLFKSAAQFDGVFLHKKKLNPLDAFWLSRYSKKIIYNFDDAVMFNEENPQSSSWLRFISFRRTVRLADMIIVGSFYLAEQARKFNSSVEVLPLGLKVSDYNVAAPAKTDDKIRLVWIGSANTLKYLEEIKPALETVGSRFPDVVLRIIGDKFLNMQNMPVEKKTWSQQNRYLDLVTSDIGLAPLPDNRFAQGKCSFKVLEYSAAGLPVVASPVGTNRENIREDITGFLTSDVERWIEKITILVKDPQLRQTMGRQGRQYTKQFDVSVIGKCLCEIISKCLMGDA